MMYCEKYAKEKCYRAFDKGDNPVQAIPDGIRHVQTMWKIQGSAYKNPQLSPIAKESKFVMHYHWICAEESSACFLELPGDLATSRSPA